MAGEEPSEKAVAGFYLATGTVLLSFEKQVGHQRFTGLYESHEFALTVDPDYVGHCPIPTVYQAAWVSEELCSYLTVPIFFCLLVKIFFNDLFILPLKQGILSPSPDSLFSMPRAMRSTSKKNYLANLLFLPL